MVFAAAARPEIAGKILGKVEGQKPGAQNGQTCCVTSPWQHSGQSQRLSESIHYKVHKNTIMCSNHMNQQKSQIEVETEEAQSDFIQAQDQHNDHKNRTCLMEQIRFHF